MSQAPLGMILAIFEHAVDIEQPILDSLTKADDRSKPRIGSSTTTHETLYPVETDYRSPEEETMALQSTWSGRPQWCCNATFQSSFLPHMRVIDQLQSETPGIKAVLKANRIAGI